VEATRPATARRQSLLERRYLREGGELGLVALAFLLYFIVRGNVADRTDLAMDNARRIIDWQRSLGIYWEPQLQHLILDSQLLIQVFNAIYFWLDFPLIAGLGLFMYFFRRRQYTFTRDAILLSGALALVSYHLFPVAPPRLLAETGMVDTLQRYSNLSYQAQSTGFFVNPYAAMPSLHVGWAFLLAIGVVWAFPGNKLVLVLAVLHPVSQTASTILTGNHYILDAVGGLVVAAGGLLLAIAMRRWGYPALGRLVSGSRDAG
jgi:membrane-associated phospholipid phosphatase